MVQLPRARRLLRPLTSRAALLSRISPRLALLLPLLLASKLAVRLAARGKRAGSSTVSSAERQQLIAELRAEVSAPLPHAIGGETLDADTYQRFLQVHGWSLPKAAAMLSKDIEWRKRVRPRALRPRHMPAACSQRGWVVLMRHQGSGNLTEDEPSPPEAAAAHSGRPAYLPTLRIGHYFGRGKGGGGRSLHPPHTKPPLAHWVYTRHGMPVTYVNVRAWHPERFTSRDECTRFCAYHMEHYIRRMPVRRGRRVQRACILISLSGFKASMVPHVCECIQVLRRHYPGRLGVACLYNTPSYWYPFW